MNQQLFGYYSDVSAGSIFSRRRRHSRECNKIMRGNSTECLEANTPPQVGDTQNGSQGREGGKAKQAELPSVRGRSLSPTIMTHGMASLIKTKQKSTHLTWHSASYNNTTSTHEYAHIAATAPKPSAQIASHRAIHARALERKTAANVCASSAYEWPPRCSRRAGLRSMTKYREVTITSPPLEREARSMVK